MDDGAADGTSDGDFAAVADPDHAFECSFADLDSLVEQASEGGSACWGSSSAGPAA